MAEYTLTQESPTPPKNVKANHSPLKPDMKRKSSTKVAFTSRQGQLLAFICLYRKLHRQGPAEADLVRFFRVTPPSVHGTIVKLEKLGLITREPGVARSMRVAIATERLPQLENTDGPPW